MASIVEQRPDIKRADAPPLEEVTHGVCGCQVEADPRLALCGADCSGESEGWTSTPCVVCINMIGTPCQFCGGK